MNNLPILSREHSGHINFYKLKKYLDEDDFSYFFKKGKCAFEH